MAIIAVLIALLFWQGADVVEAQNLWRRWYLAHNLPRVGGQPVWDRQRSADRTW